METSKGKRKREIIKIATKSSKDKTYTKVRKGKREKRHREETQRRDTEKRGHRIRNLSNYGEP